MRPMLSPASGARSTVMARLGRWISAARTRRAATDTKPDGCGEHDAALACISLSFLGCVVHGRPRARSGPARARTPAPAYVERTGYAPKIRVSAGQDALAVALEHLET